MIDYILFTCIKAQLEPQTVTVISDILEGLPVQKLDDVAASQCLIDNLQHHASNQIDVHEWELDWPFMSLTRWVYSIFL
jgi:hypothetical protein